MPQLIKRIHNFLLLIQKRIQDSMSSNTTIEFKSLFGNSGIEEIRKNLDEIERQTLIGEGFDLTFGRNLYDDSLELLIKFHTDPSFLFLVDDNWDFDYKYDREINCSWNDPPKKGVVKHQTIIPIKRIISFGTIEGSLIEFWKCLDGNKKTIESFFVESEK